MQKVQSFYCHKFHNNSKIIIPYNGHLKRLFMHTVHSTPQHVQKQRSQVTSHKSLFYQHRKNPKQSLKLTLGQLRPKQELLGLMFSLVIWLIKVVSVLVKQRPVTCALYLPYIPFIFAEEF